jgi:hypothetical protein
MLRTLLLLTFALAATADAKSSRIEKDGAGKTVTVVDTANWPWPWDAPRTLSYDLEQRIETTRRGRTSLMRSTEIQHITGDPGGGQVWRASDAKVEYPEGFAAEQRAQVEALNRSINRIGVRVTLDAQGATTGIGNLAELLPEFRRSIEAVALPAQEKALAAMENEAERARAKETSDRLLQAITSEAVIAAELMRLPVAYNFPGKGGVVMGETIQYEEDAPNPLGGDPFPMQGSFRVDPPATEGGPIEMTWTVTMDPERSAPVLLDTAERMMGKTLSADERAKLPGRVVLRVVTRYRIDAATGVIQWLERSETRDVFGARDERFLVMTLRPEA